MPAALCYKPSAECDSTNGHCLCRLPSATVSRCAHVQAVCRCTANTRAVLPVTSQHLFRYSSTCRGSAATGLQNSAAVCGHENAFRGVRTRYATLWTSKQLERNETTLILFTTYAQNFTVTMGTHSGAYRRRYAANMDGRRFATLSAVTWRPITCPITADTHTHTEANNVSDYS